MDALCHAMLRRKDLEGRRAFARAPANSTTGFRLIISHLCLYHLRQGR